VSRHASQPLLVVFAAAFVVAAGCSSDSSAPSTAPTTDIGADAATEDTRFEPRDTGGTADAATDATEEGAFGWPCETGADCLSGYCIQPSAGADSICTETCFETCDAEGYACLPVENLDGDGVLLCLPTGTSACSPCASDFDCGNLAASCTAMLDGRFCALPCAADGTCPSGYVCETEREDDETVALCIPELGVCASCWDRDADNHGIGLDCLGDDCNDRVATIYEGAAELCNGVDDDCDDAVDEGFRFDRDPDHCGGCGQACADENTVSACEDGTCVVVECLPGFTDCNGRADDGCERPDAELNACGGCDDTPDAEGGACGTCDSGSWICDGLGSLVCVGDAGDDALNACGGCGGLEGDVGEPCGACGSGTLGCAGGDALTCVGAGGDELLNACGGCDTLGNTPGETCGTCGSGAWTCSEDGERVSCVGDRGEGARNSCGGCDVLAGVVDEPCGPCLDGRWACADINAITCIGASPDADEDTICDDVDVCPGGDDTVDTDDDGTPDDCDVCPDDATDDSDEDGVCDGVDRCAGGDDTVDGDADGVPDACDRCVIGDDALDADGDDVPDACDCDTVTCEGDIACTETRTGARCGCPDGFDLTADGCVDIDECAERIDDCASQANCENTDGSYTCTCRAGYVGDGIVCRDVNECADGTDLCDENAACTNNPGSYTCACLAGFTGDGFVCGRDECAEGLDDCHPAATCTDTPEAFECTCPDGWEGDGRTCISPGFTCADVDVESRTGVVIDGTYSTCGRNSGSTCPGLDFGLRVQWAAPETRTYEISTCGSSYDTSMGIYDDTSGNDCGAGLRAAVSCCDDCGSCGTRTVHNLSAQRGRTYLIHIEGYSSSCGSPRLTITPR